MEQLDAHTCYIGAEVPLLASDVPFELFWRAAENFFDSLVEPGPHEVLFGWCNRPLNPRVSPPCHTDSG